MISSVSKNILDSMGQVHVWQQSVYIMTLNFRVEHIKLQHNPVGTFKIFTTNPWM